MEDTQDNPTGLYMNQDGHFHFNKHVDGRPDVTLKFNLVLVCNNTGKATKMPWYIKMIHIQFYWYLMEALVLNQTTVYFTQWAGPFKQILYPVVALFLSHLFLGSTFELLARSFTK